METRGLTKLNELSISFSHAPWGFIVVAAALFLGSSNYVKTSFLQADFCMCVISAEWHGGVGISGFESNWVKEGGNGTNRYDFTPCEFCKANGIFGPDDFWKPCARHNSAPTESGRLGPILHCRNQRRKSERLWAEWGLTISPYELIKVRFILLKPQTVL